MTNSFYNGVSGIKTHQFGMDVWSNNISNINNVGYKAKRPEFSNIFSQTLSNSFTNPANSQVGLGSSGQTTAILERAGGYKEGDAPFDMALTNEGWFGTQGSDGNIYYTRKGDFSLNADGNLVAKNGNFLLGTMGNIDQIIANSTNEIKLSDVASQQIIKLPSNLSIPAQPTTYVNIKANLDPDLVKDFKDLNLKNENFTKEINSTNNTINLNGNIENITNLQNPKVGDTVFVLLKDKNGTQKQISTVLKDDLTWSIKDANLGNLDSSSLEISAKIRSYQEIANTSSISTIVYTSNGDKNRLKLDFEKQVPTLGIGTSWSVKATILDENDQVLSSKDGNLKFNENGALISNDLTAIDNNGTLVNINLGTILKDGVSSSGFNGITSVKNGSYGAGDIGKDGNKSGTLEKYTLDDYGQIQANFDNGVNIPVAKVAVYHFQNDQGLHSDGGNYFIQTANSGNPIFYKNVNGDFINGTKIDSYKLEMSNVDFATALTEVIVMQKAYDASSKSITTSDQLIQNAINMKR